VEIKNKKILVTGGAGFIGSHLAERLVKMNSDIIVIDNLQAGREENLKQVWNKIKFIKGDIRDKNLVRKIVKDVTIIFHVAANASVPNSVENPRYDFETNALGTFNLLEAAIESNVEKIIYASSAAVYGNPLYIPIDEKHPLNPISPYGASKLAGEKVGFAFKETYGIPFVSIRIFNTWGPRQPRYVIYDFIKKLRQNPKRLDVLGDGSQIRDYCYISDMIDAFILVAEKGNGIYNAAGGEPISIREVAELIASKFSPNAEIVYGGKRWKGDIDTLVADISRLRNLGFEPKWSLKKGDKLEDMLHFL
jgi:UDP-glucose 4-epimerase